MRRLHEAALSNPDARLAIEMFCYSVRKQIAAMIAVLDGVDMIVFTGGIGENDGEVRAAICGGLSWAGVNIDAAQIHRGSNPLSNRGSVVQVLVLASQEDEQIARHSWALCPSRAPR
jgi:acetate kinase